jgi:hypothetical protein
MPRVTVHAVTIRTTSDSSGHPHGIVTGLGLRPEWALEELKQDAQTQAKNAAKLHSTRDAPRPSSDSHVETAEERERGRKLYPTRVKAPDPKQWRFEVVDVRLVPAMIEGKNGWLAYGTLLSEGKEPR